MAVAYSLETPGSLSGQLQSTGLDSTTASQITSFLAANGKFNPDVTLETSSKFGNDSTPGVDIYQVSTPNISIDATSETLPTASAIITTTANDTLSIANDAGNSYLIATGAGDDSLNVKSGSTGHDTILTGSGDDSINLAGSGADTVYTGTGNDSVAAYSGANTLYGYSSTPADGGDDFFQLGGGANTVYTSDGDNQLNIFAGTNNVYLSGSNTIHGYNGQPDALSGYYNLVGDNTSITLGTSTNDIMTGQGSWSIGGATGGSDSIYTEADSTNKIDLSGTTASNLVQTEGGASTIAGSDNGDTFNVFGGNNSITGGSGDNSFDVKTSAAQTLAGTDGTDYFNIASASANATLAGGSGVDQYNLDGVTSGAISITGSAGGDSLNFLNYDSSQATVTTNTATDTATYTFGGGTSNGGLTVSVSNASDVTIHFKNS